MCFCVEFCGRHEKFCEKKNFEPNGRTFDQNKSQVIQFLCNVFVFTKLGCEG